MNESEFIKACQEVLLEYNKSLYKGKLTDLFLEIQNGKGTQHQLYKKYIKDIGQAENFDTIISIYLEAIDLLQSKAPVTPYSKDNPYEDA